MNYAISEVYVIVLMDGFTFPDSSKERYLHDICLCNRENGEVFYEDLGFIYIGRFDLVSAKAKRTLRSSECKAERVRALLSESNDQ